MTYYVAGKKYEESHWSVLDEEDRLCYTTTARTNANAVAEFLQDPRTPHFEGMKAWVADVVTENRKDG